MKLAKKIWLFMCLVICLVACQEPYYPDNLDASENIPVIEGELLNTEGPHNILLYYASPYLEKSYSFISGATAYIMENNAVRYDYQEQDRGRYTIASGALNPQPGSEYQIFIELQNGLTFESIKQVMPDTLSISSVFEQREQRDIISRQYDGDVVVYYNRGLAHYMVVDDKFRNKAFIKAEGDFYLDLIRSETDTSYNVVYSELFPGGVDTLDILFRETIYRCRMSRPYRDLPSIGILDPQFQQNKNKRTYLSTYIPDGRPYVDEIWGITGEYVSHRLFHISQETYQFYKDANEQLNAHSRLFDPIATQLAGNLRCTNDPSGKIIGLWEVSALTVNQPPALDSVFTCDTSVYIDSVDYSEYLFFERL